jgi:hypothetical protein
MDAVISTHLRLSFLILSFVMSRKFSDIAENMNHVILACTPVDAVRCGEQLQAGAQLSSSSQAGTGGIVAACWMVT